MHTPVVIGLTIALVGVILTAGLAGWLVITFLNRLHDQQNRLENLQAHIEIIEQQRRHEAEVLTVILRRLLGNTTDRNDDLLDPLSCCAVNQPPQLRALPDLPADATDPHDVEGPANQTGPANQSTIDSAARPEVRRRKLFAAASAIIAGHVTGTACTSEHTISGHL